MDNSVQVSERILKPQSGYLALILLLPMLAATIFFFSAPDTSFLGLLFVVVMLFQLRGLVVVSPNSSVLLLLFGAYRGSIKQNGLFWVNPFYQRANISLRARNFDSETVKVNDKMGNPILIGVILVWKVKDTYKARFEVDNHEKFIKTQTEAAVRKLAASYPYDHFEDERAAITLSTHFDEINQTLEHEIAERLEIAGIQVVEARIAHLAYAPEIASVMLKRQQASAVVAARHKIVEGAVGMVESALHLLSSKQIIELDEEKKAAMVSNLMVVLCGDRESQPVVNTGTLNT
jgi:regulator of protease activity HflC (stomatin/prohibitin superfamily)